MRMSWGPGDDLPLKYVSAVEPRVLRRFNKQTTPRSFLPPSTMIFSVLSPLLLLPFVSAAGVHRLKLQKLQLQNHNPVLETAYLSEKYGGLQQTPLMGAGGAGRQLRVNRPSKNEDGDDLLWTQEMIFGGGHNVPLSSRSFYITSLPSHVDLFLSDFMNAQYFTTITLGSPAQEVRFDYI